MHRLLPCMLIIILVMLNTLNAAEPDGFAWEQEETRQTITLKYLNDPVLQYMHAYNPSSRESLHETYKVYTHVYGPGTRERITKGPGGKYTHHRGLFLGYNKTIFDGEVLDFWHCRNGVHLKHMKVVSQSADNNQASLTTEIHWNDKNGKPVVQEFRSMQVKPINLSNGLAWQIDCQSQLISKRGQIELNGDRQHAGFQFRADQPVADANSARYIRPADVSQHPKAIQVNDKGNPPAHSNLKWFAMTYPLGDNQYTIEYFPQPDFPQPVLFSERPYGRFGAFFKSTIDEDHPLEMKYRVIVSSGDSPRRDTIGQRYDQFLKTLEAK